MTTRSSHIVSRILRLSGSSDLHSIHKTKILGLRKVVVSQTASHLLIEPHGSHESAEALAEFRWFMPARVCQTWEIDQKDHLAVD